MAIMKLKAETRHFPIVEKEFPEAEIVLINAVFIQGFGWVNKNYHIDTLKELKQYLFKFKETNVTEVTFKLEFRTGGHTYAKFPIDALFSFPYEEQPVTSQQPKLINCSVCGDLFEAGDPITWHEKCLSGMIEHVRSEAEARLEYEEGPNIGAPSAHSEIRYFPQFWDGYDWAFGLPVQYHFGYLNPRAVINHLRQMDQIFKGSTQAKEPLKQRYVGVWLDKPTEKG